MNQMNHSSRPATNDERRSQRKCVKKLTIVVAFLCATAMHTGCAFTSETISIDYVPAEPVKSQLIFQNQNINVSVKDSRKDNSWVSSKKNGFGRETAPILSSEPVPEVIAGAIKDELTKRGAEISNIDPTKSIGVDITTFYNDFKLGMFSGKAVADLSMDVTVKDKGNRTLFNKTIESNETIESLQLLTGDNAKKALEGVLSKGIDKLFSDPQFLECVKR